MTTAHAPEGLNPSTAPEQGTDTAVSTAEQNAIVADDSQKLDVDDLKSKVEDPTVGNADESRDFTADELKKDDVAESGTGARKAPDLTPEDMKMIAEAQAAYNAQEQKTPTPKGDGNVEALIENLTVGGKNKAEGSLQDHTQDHADERPPRHFPLDNRRGGKNRGNNNFKHHQSQPPKQQVQPPAVVVAPVVAAPAPAVEPPKPVAATQLTPKTAPVQVQNVTPVPPPEDTEVAALQAQARSNAQSPKRFSRWSPETERKFGYWAMALVAVFLGIWALSHLIGDSKKSDVPNVPVEEVAKVMPPAPTAANQVLLDKLQQMDNRLAEALPSQADLAFLDEKITEAENAGASQLEHIPCFKDPNQKRCTDAVKAERVYYDSDFSHPRDVALGKIPYKKTTDKSAPKKASKKVTKK